MLVPAQLHKEVIKQELIKRWYDPKFQYYSVGGCDEVTIADNNFWRRDFAYIDDTGTPKGYFAYGFNECDKSMHNFGLVGFKDNNTKFVREVINHCLYMITSGVAQRAEIWCVADNPVIKLYRRCAKQYGGQEIARLHRTHFFDGKFHDDVVFEFLTENVCAKLGLNTPKLSYDFGDLSEYEDIG